jgi:hypothetical protein
VPDLDEARRQGVPLPPPFDEEAMKAGWFGNEGGWVGVWSFEPGTDVLWSYFEGIDLAPQEKWRPLDVEAAVAELREIADGRGDLLAERAGVTLGFYARENRDEWPRRALEAASCIAAGVDLTRLMEWIAVGQERAERIR